MSAAVAINAHAPAPAPAPGARESPGRAMDAAAFASVIDALAPGPPHATGRADRGSIGDGRRAPHPAGGDGKSAPRKAPHIEQALANLPLVAPASSQGAPIQAAAMIAAPRESLAMACVARTVVAPGPPTMMSAPDLPLAQVSAPANALPPPPAPTTIDPALNAQQARARTFLALDGPRAAVAATPPSDAARPVTLPPLVDQSSPAAAATAAAPTQPSVATAPALAAAALPAPSRPASDPRPNARAAPAPMVGNSASRRRVTAIDVAPSNAPAFSSAGSPAAGQFPEQPVHAPPASRRATTPREALASATAAQPTLTAALGAGATRGGALRPDQLPEYLAARLDEFKPPIASPTKSAPETVKELAVDLAPAGLGAVSVTMRLRDGKLAVEIGVSSAHALKAVEGERAALAASLGSNAQPLDALVIKQTESPRSQSDNNDAHESNREPGADPRNQPDRGAAQDRSLARRKMAGAPGRAGDLVV